MMFNLPPMGSEKRRSLAPESLKEPVQTMPVGRNTTTILTPAGPHFVLSGGFKRRFRNGHTFPPWTKTLKR
jgi:hypothetical protein